LRDLPCHHDHIQNTHAQATFPVIYWNTLQQFDFLSKRIELEYKTAEEERSSKKERGH
jgi:hypothetical protein